MDRGHRPSPRTGKTTAGIGRNNKRQTPGVAFTTRRLTLHRKHVQNPWSRRNRSRISRKPRVNALRGLCTKFQFVFLKQTHQTPTMPPYEPTKSELSSFSHGMYDMYEFCRRTNPDLLIFPLRGAQPFSASYEKIAELNEEPTPHFLLPPIGTFIDANTKTEKGLHKREKVKIVESELQNYFTQNPDSRKIMLIDEVMQGGAITRHYNIINNYLKNNAQSDSELQVCAIENGAIEKIANQRQISRYRTRAKRHGFYRISVESLFVMDRSQFLPTVIRNGDDFSIETPPEEKLESIIEEIERLH